MNRSAIYEGCVAHHRPGKHRLRYRVFMIAVDLDEIESLASSVRLFSHNRVNLLSLFDRDHAERRNEPIRPQIEAKLAEAGIDLHGGRVVLLTMPRVLNYVFNPLSVYFCYASNGALVALVHEVSNTFGERHFYVLPATVGARVSQHCDKSFFVSPFLEMPLRYEFEVVPPAQACSVAMVVRRGDEVALTASFNGARREFTDGGVFGVWLRNPLLTFKVIVGIHWEALKMLVKGVRYLGRQPAGSSSDAAKPLSA